MNIVVIDDEPELLELISDVLRAECYRVLPFDHPAAVTRLKEIADQPALFLIDIMLPEVNGIELAARLNDDGFTMPKIAVSASREWIRAAQESRLFRDTLSKPFDIDQLLDCVHQYVDSSPPMQ